MFLKFSSGHEHRARKLEIANRVRNRARDTRRPIADVLEIRLAEIGKLNYVGDSEIHRSLVAYQRFQFSKGAAS